MLENHSRIIEDGKCELYKQARESVIHVLWSCGVAQDIWVGSIRHLQKGRTDQDDFMQLVEDLTHRLSDEE